MSPVVRRSSWVGIRARPHSCACCGFGICPCISCRRSQHYTRPHGNSQVSDSEARDCELDSHHCAIASSSHSKRQSFCREQIFEAGHLLGRHLLYIDEDRFRPGSWALLLSDYFRCIGGPLAWTQPFDKFFSKPDFGSPSGLLPPGTPSIEVGGVAPYLTRWVSPEGRGRLDFQNRALRTTYQRCGSGRPLSLGRSNLLDRFRPGSWALLLSFYFRCIGGPLAWTQPFGIFFC
jgi:hypothetical protein